MTSNKPWVAWYRALLNVHEKRKAAKARDETADQKSKEKADVRQHGPTRL